MLRAVRLHERLLMLPRADEALRSQAICQRRSRHRKQLQIACVRTLPLPAFFARPQSVASDCSHCDPQFLTVSLKIQ